MKINGFRVRCSKMASTSGGFFPSISSFSTEKHSLNWITKNIRHENCTYLSFPNVSTSTKSAPKYSFHYPLLLNPVLYVSEMVNANVKLFSSQTILKLINCPHSQDIFKIFVKSIWLGFIYRDS